MVQWLDASEADFEADFERFLQAPRGEAEDVASAVQEIIQTVRSGGDEALCMLTERFDRLSISVDQLAFTQEEIDQACSQVAPPLAEAIELAAKRIRAYHEKQLPEGQEWVDEAGVRLGWKWSAVDAAGLYVPGGTAAYPSSVLMNAIPAEVAGVPRRAMVVPSPEGKIAPAVLYAARTAGINEIWRIGGAQAIAALAYGTKQISPVNVIVGPGNAYVAEAKRQVFGKVGIDSIAGPSEIAIIADESANADWVAIDLLAQAEHDPDAQSILISPSRSLADRVSDAVDRLLPELPRMEIAKSAWENHGAIILARDLSEAAALSNRLAPEHLEIATAQPDRLLRNIRHAGAIFIGHQTPEAFGDYIAGPNHVLPTFRSASYASGLSVLNFMKRSTLMEAPMDVLAELAHPIETLAEAEGLEAHRRSIAFRRGAPLKI